MPRSSNIQPRKIAVGLGAGVLSLGLGIALAVSYLFLGGAGDYNLSSFFLVLGTGAPLVGGFAAGRGGNWRDGFMVGLLLGVGGIWSLSVAAPGLLSLVELPIVAGYSSMVASVGAAAAGQLGAAESGRTGQRMRS